MKSKQKPRRISHSLYRVRRKMPKIGTALSALFVLKHTKENFTVYSETRKPKTKHFFLGLLVMLIVYIIGCVLNVALKAHPLLCAVSIFVMCCAAVYLVYIRYTVSYTYSLGKKAISVSASSGRKHSETTVEYKKISDVKFGPAKIPFSHKTYTNSIFCGKKCLCIFYNKGKSALIIEASDTFYKKLKEHIK